MLIRDLLAQVDRAALEQRFWCKAERRGDCLIWTKAVFHSKHDDYGAFVVSLNGKTYTVRAHRMSYALTHDAFDESLKVCHECDTPLCIEPTHLFTGTQQVNMDDCKAKGRTATGDRNAARRQNRKGEANGHARLTEGNVRMIRYRAAQGEHPAVLAAEYGIALDYARQIITRQAWPHVA